MKFKTTIVFLFAALFVSAQSVVWQKSFTRGDIFSSPRCEDLNNDGVKDVIIGGGIEGDTSLNGIIALNGINGNTLWSYPLYDNVFSSAIFTDINHDGKKDVVMGGRLANLLALDGVTGQLIWEFYDCTDFNACLNDTTLLYFYTPVEIPDANNDGVSEFVVTYGGFRDASAADTVRPHGYLMVINGATGDSVIVFPTPDLRETYCSPVIGDINHDGVKEIYFGTGGETVGGSLWMITLNNLLYENPQFIQLATSSTKGFIAPVSLADFNADGILDIIAMCFDGTLYVINGADKTVMLQRNFPGSESASQPCIGYFNNDSVPDIAQAIYNGIFPAYNSFTKYLLDGTNLQTIYSKTEGTFSYHSLLAVDADSNAVDEVIITNHYNDGILPGDQFSIYSYNPTNQDSLTLFHSTSAFNYACTPTLNDVDEDGFLDLFFSHSSFSLMSQRQFYITRVSTGISSTPAPSWGEYMGTNRDNVFIGRPSTGAPFFTEVSQQAGINHVTQRQNENYLSGGAAWFDYNNDGFVDLYLTGGGTADKFYKNNGDGSFTDVTAQAGFSGMAGKVTNGVISGDIDNDGYRDLFIFTSKNYHNYLFRNNGNGTFTDISASAGFTDFAESASAAFGDYNKDGFLDLFVGNGVVNIDLGVSPVPFFKAFPNNFYLNNGNNTFTDLGTMMGVADTISSTLASTFTDYDFDNDPDLLLANEYGSHSNNQNQLLRNNYPQDSYTDVSIPTGMNIAMDGMGIAKGDYDEDGDFDFYITNIGRDVLMKNNGNGTFSNAINGTGLERDFASLVFQGFVNPVPKVSWGTAFFDYDNDAHLDLFVASGHVIFDYMIVDTNKLYHSNGDGTFTDVSGLAGVEASEHSRGFAYADYDNDGDLDMVVCVQDTMLGNRHALIYRNDLPPGNWVKFNLIGIQSNRDACGALVMLKTGNRTFLHEITCGSSYASQNSSTVHFGLGNLVTGGGTIDSLIIHWPSGIIDSFSSIQPNFAYTIEEGGDISEVFTASYTAGTISCFGETTTVTISASGGTPPYSGTGTFSVPVGTYTYNVTDADSNTASTVVTIEQPTQLIAQAAPGASTCDGEQVISVTATGGVLPHSGTGSFLVSTTGTFNYTVTDSNGCNATASITVSNIIAPLSATGVVADVSCFGMSDGQIDVSVAGGMIPYTYHWNDGFTTEDRSSLFAGNYALTVTDSNACTSDVSFNILQPDSIIINVITASADSGNNTGAIDIAVAGGISPYSYQWSNGANTEDINQLPFGNYSVTVNDFEGCEKMVVDINVAFISSVPVNNTTAIKIFPNPTTGRIFIYLSLADEPEIVIINPAGQKMDWSGAYFTDKLELDISNLPPSLYLLNIKTESGDFRFKILKTDN